MKNPKHNMLNEVAYEIMSAKPFWCHYCGWNFSRPTHPSKPGYLRLLCVIRDHAPIKFKAALRAVYNRYHTPCGTTMWNRVCEAKLITKTPAGWELSNLGKRYVVAAEASFT